MISRPEVLDDWLRKQGINPRARSHLIVGAGSIVPGFRLGNAGIEFFVHAPFSDQRDKSEVDRNGESSVFHATIQDGPGEVRLLLTGDTPFDVLGRIVETSEKAGNQRRLAWDVVKVPHHASYNSLGPSKGEQVTTPVPAVRRLYETFGQKAGIIVSPSKVIPASDETQPPHKQAATYYKRAAKKLGGDFVVTMEHPTKRDPKPVNLRVGGSGQGVALEKASLTGPGALVTRPPKAGDHLSDERT